MKMRFINWLLKKLLIYKFKKYGDMYGFSFAVDERADINVLLEIDGKQGTQIPGDVLRDYYKWSKEKAPFNFNPCD